MKNGYVNLLNENKKPFSMNEDLGSTSISWLFRYVPWDEVGILRFPILDIIYKSCNS